MVLPDPAVDEVPGGVGGGLVVLPDPAAEQAPGGRGLVVVPEADAIEDEVERVSHYLIHFRI